MNQATKRMCRGELVARVLRGLRSDPQGVPVFWLKQTARDHGHKPAEIMAQLLRRDRAKIAERGTPAMRWLVPGPHLN